MTLKMFKCDVCGNVEAMPFLARKKTDLEGDWKMPLTPEGAALYDIHVCSKECALQMAHGLRGAIHG